MRKNRIFRCLILLCVCVSFFTFNTIFAKGEENIELSNLNVNVCGFESDSSGDCSLITYKDVQMIVDTSEGEETLEEIKTKISNIMSSAEKSDKVWDFFILTHGDSDHLGNAIGVLDYIISQEWTIGTIIDFEMKDASEEFNNKFYTKTFNEYKNKRNEIINNYDTEYFSASELSSSKLYQEYCFGSNEEPKMKILYNYFDNYSVLNELSYSSHLSFYHNVVSVCFTIEYGNNKILFTGDIEEYDSSNSYLSPVKESDLNDNAKEMIEKDKINYSVDESSLDDRIGGERLLLAYHRKLISNATLYKAAHHGSNTSNCSYLLETVKPQYVAITKGSASGSSTNLGYFPTPTVINDLLYYTDYIYPTKVIARKDENSSDIVDELFGNLLFVFSYDKLTSVITDKNNSVKNNATAPEIWNAKLTEDKTYLECLQKEGMIKSHYFTIPYQIINFAAERTNSYGNCSLVKLGHYDILIDCGNINDLDIDYINKIKNYCIDGVIEYVIVSNANMTNYTQLIGTYSNNKSNKDGVFDKFVVNNLIDFGSASTLNSSNTTAQGWFQKYIKYRKNVNKYYSIDINGTEVIDIIPDILSLKIYGSNNDSFNNNYDLSITSVFTFSMIGEGDTKAVFVGDSSDFDNIKNDFKKSDVIYFRAPSCFCLKNEDDFIEGISAINPKNIVIGSYIGYTNTSGDTFGNKKYLAAILSGNTNINRYCIGSILDGIPINDGTLKFNIYYDYEYGRNDYFLEAKSINRKNDADKKWLNNYLKSL
jgi:beta-lactamase superfamily II metal-dependent hydrolase